MEATGGIKKSGLDTDKTKNTDCGERMNPFAISVIANAIASYINKVDDMKCLRILSRAGTQETFKKWRNSATLSINDETLPLLVKAYSEENWEDLDEEEKSKIDPFQLRQVPFKKYRFSREQSWAYPLEDDELDKKLIWEKVIKPNATYLDVGECELKLHLGQDEQCKNYNYGLYWIVNNSKNVKGLAMTPVKSRQGLQEEPENRLEINEFFENWPRVRDFKTYASNEVHQNTQLESLTISVPDVSADEAQIKISLFRDEDEGSHEPDGKDLAKNLFTMTPNLKNFQLKRANTDEANNIMSGLKHSDKTPRIFLESLDVVEVQPDDLPNILYYYLRHYFNYFWLGPDQERQFQGLKMSCTFSDCVKFEFCSPLLCCYQTLTRLEVKIDCEMKKDAPPIKTRIYLAGLPFLISFKMNLDYKTFPGRLPTFDLNDLEGFPLLQEFHFGTSGNLVDKAWIQRKLNFEEDISLRSLQKFYSVTGRSPADLASISRRLAISEGKASSSSDRDITTLPYLKSFHFHGNFTKEALYWLGKMTEKLKTLEVVLDKENFSAVKEFWLELRNLKLLPCSNVPQEDVKAMEDSNPSWNVVNECENYLPCAWTKIPLDQQQGSWSGGPSQVVPQVGSSEGLYPCQ